MNKVGHWLSTTVQGKEPNHVVDIITLALIIILFTLSL